jgi:precorrin-4/cobalt-precorrin-4 C11-methyltransferase
MTDDRKDVLRSPDSKYKPAVYIIGTGTGDPELLTIKAKKIIDRADVILVADSLIPPQIYRDCRQDAEIITTSDKNLEEIVSLTIARVRNNLVVARLHSGDLSLYSAIREQIECWREAEIPFELISGISIFQAAAAKLETELTIPNLVQTIILTRISGRASAVPEKEDLASLAAHQASLCLYLAANLVETAREKLLEHYSADTPVAICYRLGWEEEKIWVVSLAEMAAVSRSHGLTRSTLYIVSPALRKEITGRSPKEPSLRSQLYSKN